DDHGDRSRDDLGPPEQRSDGLEPVTYLRVRDTQLARDGDRSERVGEIVRTEKREADPEPLPVDERSTQSQAFASPVARCALRSEEDDPAPHTLGKERTIAFILRQQADLAAVEMGEDLLLLFCYL